MAASVSAPHFGRLTMAVKIKVTKETLVHKGEHFFHSSYLAAESLLGHGPLQWLAAGALLMVLVGIVLHVEGH